MNPQALPPEVYAQLTPEMVQAVNAGNPQALAQVQQMVQRTQAQSGVQPPTPQLGAQTPGVQPPGTPPTPMPAPARPPVGAPGAPVGAPGAQQQRMQAAMRTALKDPEQLARMSKDYQGQESIDAERLRRAQANYDKPGAKGIQTGDIYTAASPLAHLADGLRQYKGLKNMKEARDSHQGSTDDKSAALAAMLRSFGG